MNIEDLIVCSAYADIPGIHLWGNVRGQQIFDAPPDSALVFCTTDDIAQFFALHGDNGRNYTVVSACSDLGVAYQTEYPFYKDIINYIDYLYEREDKLLYAAPPAELFNPHNWVKPGCQAHHRYSVRTDRHTHYTFEQIPANISRWYQTNPHFVDPRVIPIPFGIAEGSREAVWQAMQATHHKFNGIYVNMSRNTSERDIILTALKKEKHPHITIREGGLSREQYLEELASHSMSLVCPGVGLDSYRLWESLYLKTVPIVRKNLEGLLGKSRLPRRIYHTANDVFYWANQETDFVGATDALSMSYWHKQMGIS